MAGWTNKGKTKVLGISFVDVSVPTNYYIALVTSANVPDADTNLMSDLTEIAAGNGYTAGGFSLTPGATDFDVLTEDDANDRGFVQIKNVAWIASGGDIPSSGDPARYAVLTDDNGTVDDREIYGFMDLIDNVTIPSGETLTLINITLRANES